MPPIIHVGPKVTDENGYLELTTKVVNEYTCYMLVNIISYVEDNVDTEFDFSHYEVYKGEVLLENLNVPIEDGVYFVKVTDSSGNTATLQVTHTNLEE